MIYLITNQEQLFTDTIYTKVPLSHCIEYLGSTDFTVLDCETEGFDCHSDKMISLQVGNKNDQYVIDTLTVDIKPLKRYLESVLVIGQNLKFDLKFLFKQGIYLRKIYDTFIAERVLYCGIPDRRAGLDSLTKNYLNIEIDKSIRGSIAKEGLSTRVIKYAADDLIYLEDIRDLQLEELRKKELIGTINLENRFTSCLAYIEYCGFKLDVDKWKAKMKLDNERLRIAEDALNSWILNKGMAKYFKQQLSLFDDVSCKVNWASPKQIIELFTDLGIDCSFVDKGVVKQSVEASVIDKFKKDFEIINLYLEYKKADKVVGTYGESFLKQINKSTGRIHTNFKQILDTGRISSGGKNKATREEFINFQNIPKDKETRACFVAEEGNILIISDYAGQEQIVLANVSLDGNLLKFYDEGLSDMHSFVASKMHPALEGLTVEEIKIHHGDKRQKAKIAGFAINYGGVGKTIADQLCISLEEGNQVYEGYFRAFPGLKTYFTQAKKQGLSDGYILISPVTGRKSFIPFFDKYKELEEKMDEDFWNEYKLAKATMSSSYRELKQMVSDYFYYKGAIERSTLNFPIQGRSAEITKISCVYIFDEIIERGLFDVVKFVNTIHDENVLEVPIPIQEEWRLLVKDLMEKAGDIFCKRVKLHCDPELSIFWKK